VPRAAGGEIGEVADREEIEQARPAPRAHDREQGDCGADHRDRKAQVIVRAAQRAFEDQRHGNQDRPADKAEQPDPPQRPGRRVLRRSHLRRLELCAREKRLRSA
jgi:hypothetical protein